MREPILFRRDDVLSDSRARYWKDLLYRTVKIGTELEFALPKGAKTKEMLPLISSSLKPSSDLNRLGKLGVLDVQTEHCGIEIRVIGRQPFYPALVDQYRGIIGSLPPGMRARSTCGLHFHLLTVGLAEPMPSIILANLWNFTRRYAAALRFLTSAGSSPRALCRRRNHASHLEMVKLSPGFRSMEEIQAELRASEIVPEHQNFLNLEHVRFSSPSEIEQFHVEFRFPDADLCPTSIAAKTMLFLTMLLKSVELSQYGVIHVGKVADWRRRVQLLDWLSNNDGELATSDTSHVTPEVVEELREHCRELLEPLKPIFDRLDQGDAYRVLGFLAQEPISLLRSRGLGWSDIEKHLSGDLDAGPSGERLPPSSVERRLCKCVDLVEVSGCTSLEHWVLQVSAALFVPVEELLALVSVLQNTRKLVWDKELGAPVFRG
jgi:hypothetical protein